MDATVFHVGILHVGIDVSKDRLDGHAHETGERLSVANDTEGIPALATWAHAMAPRLIGFEAIGAYEALPAASPAQAGLPVVVVNPTQVRRFTQALGERAKTDVIDAAVIAYFLVATQPEVRPLKDEDARLLSDLVARRGQIVAMITAERQRECTAPPRVKKSIARLLKALMRALESLDGDLDNAIKASPSWRKNEDLLASVPDVGRIIARSRIADAPELDRLDRRQIAALAGLAPWTRQSGQWRRKGFIGGGRVDVRCALYAVRFTLCALHGRFTWALYMGALVAARYNPDLKAFREKLAAAGEPKMVALVAVARKLLTILNAILRDQTPGRAQNTRPTRQSLPKGCNALRKPEFSARQCLPCSRNVPLGCAAAGRGGHDLRSSVGLETLRH